MRTFIVLIFFFCTSSLGVKIFAQNTQTDSLNIRQMRPWGLGLNILGILPYGSVRADYFFNPHISAEMGIAPFPVGVYINSKYHFGKKTWKGMPYIGLGHSWTFIWNDDDGGWQFFYMPIGYQFIGKKGMDFSIEIDPILRRNEGVIAKLGIGYRFLKKKYR